MDGLRVCVCELAGHSFGLRLELVREIVPMAALSRPPAMPSLLEGFLNLRGVSIPVVRTSQVLGLPASELELHTPLVIVRTGGMTLALLVERVTGIVAFPANADASIGTKDSFNGCVEALLTNAAGTVHLLSINRLLLEKERQMLAEFNAIETKRLAQLPQHVS